MFIVFAHFYCRYYLFEYINYGRQLSILADKTFYGPTCFYIDSVVVATFIFLDMIFDQNCFSFHHTISKVIYTTDVPKCASKELQRKCTVLQ